ncbi:MAG TPA: hypothetical protein VNF28_06885 [Candidatus Binataceae bacterium]|nr:hypothetical protein [Candidatus Binataceae bacterium]
MRKRVNRSSEISVLASQIMRSIRDLDVGNKNPAAVALGRLGGQRGGKARAEKLSAEKRHEIAQGAARARWKKSPKSK